MVDGRKVMNYEGESFGQVPFSVDFAHSCNTAFTQLAATMGDSDVHDAAAALGVGSGWEKHLGVAGTFGGSVPVAEQQDREGRHGVRPGPDRGLAGSPWRSWPPRWLVEATSSPR